MMTSSGYITLSQLLQRIRNSVSDAFPAPVWVRAEIHDLKAGASGHCYMDLVEKGSGKDQFKAKAKAAIWASRRSFIESTFYKGTGERLQAGLEILSLMRVQYSELYGLTLTIEDIDPAYTLGGMELARRETIERLKREGMLEMNKALPMPALPRRFAVISSETAAGYGDFMHHLYDNGYGFSFFTRLYSAPMQGDTAPAGMIAALEAIYGDMEKGCRYDAVLLLRGGGSVSDLHCFDDYSLSAHIASFPLPVMTAVGHERDVHVCDIVAAVSVKTPTALADHIVGAFIEEDTLLNTMEDRLFNSTKVRMDKVRRGLEETGRRLATGTSMRCRMESNRMDILQVRMKNSSAQAHNRDLNLLGISDTRIRTATQQRLRAETSRLDMLALRIEKGDPRNTLHHGQALISHGGKPVTSARGMRRGDILDLMLLDGSARCKVEEVTVS